MGGIEKQPFSALSQRLLRVDFQGSRVTSDGGLILVRELDERFGLGEWIEQHRRIHAVEKNAVSVRRPACSYRSLVN